MFIHNQVTRVGDHNSVSYGDRESDHGSQVTAQLGELITGSCEQEWFCGGCGGLYEEETEESEIWIECGLCEQWFHCVCEGLSCLPPPEVNYICWKCQE